MSRAFSASMDLDNSDFSSQSYMDDNYTYVDDPILRMDTAKDDTCLYNFENKHPLTWTSDDIFYWIIHQSTKIIGDFENVNLTAFRAVTALDFLNFTKEDFVKTEPENAEWLFNCKEDLLTRNNLVKPLKGDSNQNQPNNWLFDCQYQYPHINPMLPHENQDFVQENTRTNSQLPPFSNTYHDSQPSRTHTVSYSDGESSSSSLEVVEQAVIKRSPGRPPKHQINVLRKKPENTTGRLWEFIRNLLLNKEYCPMWIKWENHEEGTFKFVDSDRIAKLWGQRKQNKQMNYEKLSRAMRYYYKREILLPVTGRRLVYKFGPNATGWKTDNPNFAKDVS